jgi:hypothetical protein
VQLATCHLRQRCQRWQDRGRAFAGLRRHAQCRPSFGNKEIAMKKLIVSTILALTVGTGCSKKSNSCEAIYDHTASLLPPDMKGALESGKADALAKCEKMSPEARQCAADAQSLADLMKCPKS